MTAPRSVWRRNLGSLGLALGALGGLGAPAWAGDDLLQRVRAARVEASADPQQALRTLQALRAEAIATDRLDARLAADEVECRVLTDLDGERALRVADAGLAATGQEPGTPARPAWLRLRACRVGALLDLGNTSRGQAELEALMALADADPGSRGLAQLERGVYRSRTGDLTGGQQDLLAACALLETAGQPADHDLCLFHLSSHYRRMGEAEEALGVLLPLHDKAHRRDAFYDDSVYLYAIARLHQLQQRWPQALERFREALTISKRLHDRNGIAYAEHGIARSLLNLRRAGEALPHARRALDTIDFSADPREGAERSVTLAEALVEMGQAARSRLALDRVGADVRRAGNQPLLARWLRVRAETMRSLGQWREAYDALAEARDIELGQHQQQLSEQSARLRLQFNRSRDQAELVTLRELNEQGRRLRQAQAVGLVLFVTLMVVAVVLAIRKVGQARHLHTLATTDELTGVSNRRALLADAEQELARVQARGGHLSVLMLDVDHFKRINDTHGHAVGDDVLRHVARELTAALRGRDTVGRVGGEEFVAVLPEAGRADALRIAERMRETVAATPAVTSAPGAVAFTVSIGVAEATAGDTIDGLLSRADTALYCAKREGRNRVCAAPASLDSEATSAPRVA